MPSSGNSYKVRLLLAFLGRKYHHVAMEYETAELANAHATGRLPLGKLPVLELENGIRLPESNAILCYLADGTAWMPTNATTRAQALGWLFWEQNQHEGTIAVRAALRTYPHRRSQATPERLAELLDAGNALLETMDRHLTGCPWFIGDHPTVADISLYAYTHSAELKGGYGLDRFPAVRAWLGRFAALPGFVTLDNIPA